MFLIFAFYAIHSITWLSILHCRNNWSYFFCQIHTLFSYSVYLATKTTTFCCYFGRINNAGEELAMRHFSFTALRHTSTCVHSVCINAIVFFCNKSVSYKLASSCSQKRACLEENLSPIELSNLHVPEISRITLIQHLSHLHLFCLE